ncbi:electron transfer flavoprotein subunit beta/FixA family protein [Undibacterium arcticum]|uniref:Electron transfer flavoprotein subunit beta/FixA family protein n=2 Tax=Undibacterium arcticum TaxID=1762892 RepID=A0ABV7F4J1_9BURK
MNHSLKIAVLVSHARHPVSGRPLRSASDAAALELACSLALPERLTVLCAGSASADDLRDYLGLGAASIEVLAVPAEADVVPALLARLSGFDLVLCGNRSEGQTASGLLPYLLAEGLRMPLIADVLEATLQGRLLTVRQFLPKGMRRRLEMSAPAILAVHPRAPQTRQFAHARAAVGRITQTTGGGHSGNIAASAWQYEPARRPRPFKATVAQSGHSRMLGAIGGDSGARGGEVVKQGNAVAKAQVLLTYLREHRLIDF